MIPLFGFFIDAIKLGTIFKVKPTRKEKHNMRQIIQKTLIIMAFGLIALPSEAQTARRERIKRDRREDVRDRREDVRDAQHQGGPLDQIEDRRDKREDVRDRREDSRDRRENRRDRRRRGHYNTQNHPLPQVVVGVRIGHQHCNGHIRRSNAIPNRQRIMMRRGHHHGAARPHRNCHR